MGTTKEQAGIAGLRVLDFTGELGPYAAKMYLGFGAEVIHLEPMGGDPLRRIGPFYRGKAGTERSLPFLYYNAGKRGLALDLHQQQGRAIFRQLVARSELLLESCAPGYLGELALDHPRLAAINPRLVHTSITPFGHTGPYRNLPGSDLTCSAMAGFLYLAGVENEPPVRPCDNQSYRMAEAYAAVGSSIALFHAQRTGEGQFVDVACIEAVGMALENSAQYWDLEGSLRRGGGREAGNGTIHPTRDGYVVLVAIIGRNRNMWKRFLQWLEAEQVPERELLAGDQWLEPAYRSSSQSYQTFCRIFERFSSSQDKLSLYERAQAAMVALSPVSTGKDLLENPQLKARKFWQTLDHPELGGAVVYPGPPYELGRIPWTLGGRAPGYGEHSREILEELGYSEQEISRLARKEVIHVG